MSSSHPLNEDILVALRRVMRAVDLQSRKLAQRQGLTGPQALLLKEILKAGQITGADLARQVSLSQATVTDICKRLEGRQLLQRVQDTQDRRKWWLATTETGRTLINESAPLLQEQFLGRLNQLELWEQTQLLASLQRIASLMDADALDASPVLTTGSIGASPQAIAEALDNQPD